MAQGSKEHRMVFDIRGRRRHVVKVVYALLAILMAASLFLVTGVLNPNTLFGTSSGGSATKSLEEQAERIEVKLAKTPEDEDMLLNLTRTRINIANTMVTNGAGESESGIEEVKQQLAQASEDWSKYLKVAVEPSPGLAIQVQPALFELAQLASSGEEAMENLKAANEAQEIVAEARPNLNSLSTLAINQAYIQEFKAATKSFEEATKFANTKFEREQLENQFEKVEENAKQFGKSLEAEEAAAKTESAGKEGTGNPLNGLGASPLTGE